MKYYIGVDIGGTNIAVGLVDENGRLLAKKSEPTQVERGCDALMEKTASLCVQLCKEQGKNLDEIQKIGIGVPGTVRCSTGEVMYSCNLPLERVNIADIISDKCRLPVTVLNDADAAAYGEYFVDGNKFESFVCITLGTGIGAGIILNGRIYNGFNGAGAEIGHTTLIKDGILCACGRKGCWEKYASATALIAQTAAAAEANPNSIMAGGKIDGQTAFRAAEKGDKAAERVISEYVEYVAEGLINVVNTFQPNKIVIGGGISKEGEPFISRIREYVYRYDYNRYMDKTIISAASLFNDAGIIGAALY
jgi:glucokinase